MSSIMPELLNCLFSFTHCMYTTHLWQPDVSIVFMTINTYGTRQSSIRVCRTARAPSPRLHDHHLQQRVPGLCGPVMSSIKDALDRSRCSIVLDHYTFSCVTMASTSSALTLTCSTGSASTDCDRSASSACIAKSLATRFVAARATISILSSLSSVFLGGGLTRLLPQQCSV